MKYAFALSLALVLLVAGWLAYAAMAGSQQAVSHIVVATGGSEGLYDELAQTYKRELEPFGVALDLRPDLDGFFTLKALVIDNTAQAGFVKGGFVGGLTGRLATDDDRTYHDKDVSVLRSVGRLFAEPIWVFTRKSDHITALRDLKGKRIFIGTKASGVRKVSAHLLKASGVDTTNAKELEEDLPADARPLLNGEIDAAILLLPPESATIQKLLRNTDIKLMNFAGEADAYANRFSYLTKVVLHQGAVELSPDVPEADLVLLSTEAALVVRKDLNPSLVTLLTHTVFNNPKPGFDKFGDPILFYRAGDYPSAHDPEFEIAADAKAMQQSRELPFLLRELGPWNARMGLPFAITAFANEHGNQLILLAIPLLTVLFPLIRVAPAAYNWAGRRRLLYWYRRLKQLELRLDGSPNTAEIVSAQTELERIDAAVARIRVPIAFTSQLYDLRLHINLVRQRLSLPPARIQPAE